MSYGESKQPGNKRKKKKTKLIEATDARLMSNPSSLPSLPPPSLLLTGAVLKRKNNGTQSQSQSQSQPAFPTRRWRRWGGGEEGEGKGEGWRT